MFDDTVPRVPPKSLWLFSLLLGGLFKRSADKEGEVPKSKKWTLSYSDTGRVVYANRSRKFKVLKPGGFLWRFQIFGGRFVSRVKALFVGSGLMGRLFPGLPDHSMKQYNRALAEYGRSEVDSEEKGGISADSYSTFGSSIFGSSTSGTSTASSMTHMFEVVTAPAGTALSE